MPLNDHMKKYCPFMLCNIIFNNIIPHTLYENELKMDVSTCKF